MAPTTYTPPINTYVPLQTITLGSSASSVTFSSIPQGYRDLVLVANLSNVASLGGYPSFQFNGDSGNNYSAVYMYGNGTSPGSQSQTGNTGNYASWDYAKSGAHYIAQIMDYSATDKQKTTLARANTIANGAYYVTATANRWANTAAITSITCLLSPRTFESGTTFSLYGIAG